MLRSPFMSKSAKRILLKSAGAMRSCCKKSKS